MIQLPLRHVRPEDAPAIAQIYNHYIRHTVATFEEQEVSEQTMAERIAQLSAKHPWLVWEESGQLVGYAYASDWKARSAYRHTVESSIYLDTHWIGKGIGRQLYQELLDLLRLRGVHLVIAGITLPNETSVALHEKMGFVKCGQFHQVGFKFGKWVDVGYWELVIS